MLKSNQLTASRRRRESGFSALTPVTLDQFSVGQLAGCCILSYGRGRFHCVQKEVQLSF